MEDPVPNPDLSNVDPGLSRSTKR